jgi:hypothetical protein
MDKNTIAELEADLRRREKQVPDDQAELDRQSNLDYAMRDRDWTDDIDIYPNEDEGHVSSYVADLEAASEYWCEAHGIEAIISDEELIIGDTPAYLDEFGYTYGVDEPAIEEDEPALKGKLLTREAELQILTRARRKWLMLLHAAQDALRNLEDNCSYELRRKADAEAQSALSKFIRLDKQVHRLRPSAREYERFVLTA